MSGLRERAHLREELLGGASQSGQLRDSGQRNRRNKGPSATEDKRWPALSSDAKCNTPPPI
jgi:hypothetical protein